MKTILFVCVENAGRSQMAEGFFKKYAPPGYRAVSAGTKPAGQISPLAVQAMKEAGIDISNQKSKVITDDMIRGSARAVNMGCMDRSDCPLPVPQQPGGRGNRGPERQAYRKGARDEGRDREKSKGTC